MRTQNHSRRTLNSCGTCTDSAHSDFASDVYVGSRACTCTAPDGQLRIHGRLHVAAMLFADTDCCTRTYVYALHRLRTSQRVNYTTVPFISKVYDRNPKSTISSGSSTGAQKPRKLSIPAPIAAKLDTGQSARLIGRAALPTNFLHHSAPSANTKLQLHLSAAAEPVPVGRTEILRDI